MKTQTPAPLPSNSINEFLRIFILMMLMMVLAYSKIFAQTQKVKGIVKDADSDMPIAGAAVVLVGSNPQIGTITNASGYFVLENVPVGRRDFSIQFLGYRSATVPNILVTAGKEAYFEVKLVEEPMDIGEVVISADKDQGKPFNEFATVSARQFNTEQVNRFSGARNDVARMAANFAGVNAADDSRNDIVIRGNSPTGVLWRLEGIPIPNPNHFATFGTTGGPVSALNPNMVRSSDFFTGAFPAEYGNATAGVFDIGFRTGNRDRHEYMFQLAAFSGLEAMAEGPMNKKNGGSYVAAYRYSFTGFARAIGIPIGTNAAPRYQDISFNLDFGEGKAGRFTLFGMGGASTIDFLGDEIDQNDLFANPDADSYPRSRMGVVGLKHQINLGKNTYVKSLINASRAYSSYTEFRQLDTATTEKEQVTDVMDQTGALRLSSFINKKFNAKLTARAGVVAEGFNVSTFVADRADRPTWDTLRDFEGWLGLYQAFVQAQYRVSPKITLQGGLHPMYLADNESFIVEPRVSGRYQAAPKHAFTLGYGLHSQMQPLPTYFLQLPDSNGVQQLTNQNLDFTRSRHLVLGYEFLPAVGWFSKVELYHQNITNAPVDPFASSFSLLNAGANFVFPERHYLVNEGSGTNIGAELTLERYFRNNFYGMLTASVFDSKYKGSDEIQRNTAFNNNYIFNILAGKEFPIKGAKNRVFTFDMKFTTAGGRPFTPVNLEESIKQGREVLYEDRAFSETLPNYLRLDMKFGYRVNASTKKLAQQFFLDFQNITNHQNVFTQRYNPQTQQINTVYQSGFFPDLLYRITF